MRGGRTEPEITSEVVARARMGDKGALAVVWRALQPALLRYLWSLGVEGAQDVASVVWIELTWPLVSRRPWLSEFPCWFDGSASMLLWP